MSFSLSECTKIDVSWGFALDPTDGADIATPDPLSLVGFKGAALQQDMDGGEGKGLLERNEGLGEEERGKGREERGVDGEAVAYLEI